MAQTGKVFKEQEINAALVDGIERAGRNNLTKPHDVATCIQVSLRRAGFKLIRTLPHKYGGPGGFKHRVG